MKPTKTTEDSMDLSSSWVDDVLKEFRSQIPILPGVPKGVQSRTITFSAGLDMTELAENIVYLRTGYFDRPSQVNRAALRIGMQLLYRYFTSNSDVCPTYKRIRAMEDMLNDMQAIELFTADVSTVCRGASKGITSFDERDELISKMIHDLPKKLHKAAKEVADKIIAGAKVSSLSEYKSHGGDRRAAPEE